MEGIKEATVDVGDLPVKVAVAHGLSNAKTLMDKVRGGRGDYHFIEIMACPGGCVGGGGQPIPTSTGDPARSERRRSTRPTSYLPLAEVAREPGTSSRSTRSSWISRSSEKSHHLLHTHYTPRTS